MKRHAKKCFGEDTVKKALQSDANGVRKGLDAQKDGSLPAAFKAKGSAVITYSNRLFSNIELRYVPHEPNLTLLHL